MTDSTEDLLIGTVLGGKYRVDVRLGAGGMGEVYRVTHLELHESRAVKLLTAKAAKDPQTVARFMREARACARLKNPHALKVHDVGCGEDGLPFMVMELLEGQDLEQLVRQQGRLGIERTAGLMLQALEAIAEAHAKGIVHRDLKPANLFVIVDIDGDESIKVLDFGISKVKHDQDGGLTSTHMVVGSPFYMSPEQMRSMRDVDVRTDIWAIGVILYRLLTGKLPFAGDSITAICAAVLQAKPTPPVELAADIPAELQELILACLRKDLEQRVSQVGIIAGVLARYAPEQARRSLKRIDKVLGEGATAVPLRVPEPAIMAATAPKSFVAPFSGASSSSHSEGVSTAASSVAAGSAVAGSAMVDSAGVAPATTTTEPWAAAPAPPSARSAQFGMVASVLLLGGMGAFGVYQLSGSSEQPDGQGGSVAPASTADGSIKATPSSVAQPPPTVSASGAGLTVGTAAASTSASSPALTGSAVVPMPAVPGSTQPRAIRPPAAPTPRSRPAIAPRPRPAIAPRPRPAIAPRPQSPSPPAARPSKDPFGEGRK